MTPDDRDAQRIDGLLASFGELMAQNYAHGERLTGHDREIRDLRNEQRDAVKELASSLKGIGPALKEIERHCDASVDSVRQDIVEQAEQAKKRRERLELTMLQRVGLAVAACGPVLTAVAMVAK